MNEIPYPKVTLRPYGPNSMGVLISLSPDVFPSSIREIFKQHISICHEAQALKYPTEPKEFYIIPFYKEKEVLEKFNLRPPKFAALWLPAIASKVDEILEQYSGEEKEMVIIAYDYSLSNFNGNLVLAADLSMGFPTFVFWENNIMGLCRNPDCHILVEPAE